MLERSDYFYVQISNVMFFAVLCLIKIKSLLYTTVFVWVIFIAVKFESKQHIKAWVEARISALVIGSYIPAKLV